MRRPAQDGRGGATAARRSHAGRAARLRTHAWLAAAACATAVNPAPSRRLKQPMMVCTLHAPQRPPTRLDQRQACTYARKQTFKQTSTQTYTELRLARRRTHTHEKHTHTQESTHTPRVPGDDTVCFPHTLFTPQLLLTLPAHALAYTSSRTHAHATVHTPNAYVDAGLYRRMDALMSKRRGARGACCSRPSPTPSLHLFLVGGLPVTAASLSRPPDHLDAPLRLTPSRACRYTMPCTPAQGRCAAREPEESRRRAHASGLAHLCLDTEPRSMRCAHA